MRKITHLRTETAVKGIVLNSIYILLCLTALLPIFYALIVSFGGKSAVLSGSLSILPKDPTLENYRTILIDEPFLLWLKNSLLLSVGTILVAMTCAIPAAYAASRWRFKGRKTLLRSLLILNAFPQVLSLFALFRVLKITGMLNSHMGLIIIYAGSMCVFDGEIMFTGDTLFEGSIGRTDLPSGSYQEMENSLRRLSQMDGDIIILPGHGDQSTIAQEKRHNPFLRNI